MIFPRINLPNFVQFKEYWALWHSSVQQTKIFY